jgi:cytochrome c5
MKKTTLLLTIVSVLSTSMIILSSACSSGNQESKNAKDGLPAATDAAKPANDERSATAKGIGEIMHVELNNPLNADMANKGKGIFEMKCSACHKLTAEKLVGPGWEGVTTRRSPEWIMNMITNTDVMLDKDPQAQKLLETCLVRMPNQGLSMGDCRNILEFMYQNDIKK